MKKTRLILIMKILMTIVWKMGKMPFHDTANVNQHDVTDDDALLPDQVVQIH